MDKGDDRRMTRLTKAYPNGFVTLDASQFPPIDQTVLDSEIRNSEPIRAAVERLAEYEDAEEKGLLVHLPCKVGDMVYPKPSFGYTAPEKVTGIYIYEHFAAIKTTRDSFDFKDFGKTVFLTREDAERALKGE